MSCSSQQSRLHVVVDEILLATNQLQDGQTWLRRESELFSDNIFHHVLQARSQTMRSIDSSHENHVNVESRERRCLQAETRISDSQFPSVYDRNSRFPFLRVKAHVQRHRQYRCIASCKCSCHTFRRFQSPPSLKAFLGVLFIGYNCSTVRPSERCSNSSCKRDAPFDARIEYTFPYWFFYNVCAALSVTSTGNPALCLRVIRARSGGSDTLRLVKSNDIRGLQALYSTGKASPIDVYQLGQTDLFVSHPSLSNIHLSYSFPGNFDHVPSFVSSASIKHLRMLNLTSHL